MKIKLENAIFSFINEKQQTDNTAYISHYWKKNTVREAAGYGVAGSQGYTKSIHKTGCRSNQCASQKNKILCNSISHATSNCENK